MGATGQDAMGARGQGLGVRGPEGHGGQGARGPWGQGAWALGPRGQGQGGQGPGEQGSEASPCPAITPNYSGNATLGGVYENAKEYVYTTWPRVVVHM